MIFCQRPDTTLAGGFQEWKSVGRSIRKKSGASLPFAQPRSSVRSGLAAACDGPGISGPGDACLHKPKGERHQNDQDPLARVHLYLSSCESPHALACDLSRSGSFAQSARTAPGRSWELTRPTFGGGHRLSASRPCDIPRRAPGRGGVSTRSSPAPPPSSRRRFPASPSETTTAVSLRLRDRAASAA